MTESQTNRKLDTRNPSKVRLFYAISSSTHKNDKATQEVRFMLVGHIYGKEKIINEIATQLKVDERNIAGIVWSFLDYPLDVNSQFRKCSPLMLACRRNKVALFCRFHFVSLFFSFIFCFFLFP
jgi:hypothetical protein